MKGRFTMPEVLIVEKLKKIYGKNIVLDGFDMNLYAGNIYGLVVNNGAGKTTFISLLVNLISDRKSVV